MCLAWWSCPFTVLICDTRPVVMWVSLAGVHVCDHKHPIHFPILLRMDSGWFLICGSDGKCCVSLGLRVLDPGNDTAVPQDSRALLHQVTAAPIPSCLPSRGM